jgi:RNA polymerase sigma factor (sigma-70 family)
LRKFITDRDQAAFAALVKRYINIVYAAARRQVNDAHLAEDVTQAVFIVLAQKASVVPTNRPLSAWLLKTTSYCAANALKTRRRRLLYEGRAAAMTDLSHDDATNDSWEHISPMLDAGLARLKSADRDLLLWRFFEARSMAQIAQMLEISEGAAGKRLSRAVEKLRDFFRRHGVSTTSVVLATLLTAKTSEAAPASLTVALTSTATASTTAAAFAKGAVILMAATKIKAAIVTTIFILLIFGSGVVAVKMAWHENPPVTIAQQSTAPAVSSTPCIIQFGNATLTLTAIGDETGKSWWSPDGTPTVRPFPPVLSSQSVLAGPGAKFRLIFLAQNINRSDEYFSPSLAGSTGTVSSSDRRADGMVIDMLGGVPAGQSTGDVNIFFATGPWQKTATYDVVSQLSTSTDFQIDGMIEKGNQTIVDVRRPGLMDWDETVRVLLDNGKEIGAVQSQSSTRGKVTYHFPCTKDQIKQIIYHARPLLKGTMKNVSLQAGKQTHPEVKIYPALSPATNPTETNL